MQSFYLRPSPRPPVITMAQRAPASYLGAANTGVKSPLNGENKLYYGVIVRRALERECEVTACLKTYLLGAPGASTKSTLGADLLSAALDSRTPQPPPVSHS